VLAPVQGNVVGWPEYLQEMPVQFMASRRGEPASACQVLRFVVLPAIGGHGIIGNEDLKEMV
jgi:hypothetical protein